METPELVSTALSLMNRYAVTVRDTYSRIESLQVNWCGEALQASAKAGNLVSPVGKSSIGYDSYLITIPSRFREQGRFDPAIHEAVHFLQHQTLEEERAYFSAQPTETVRYLRYLSQRVETEAHFIQIAYLAEEGSGRLQSIVEPGDEAEIRAALRMCALPSTPQFRRLDLVIRCKAKGLV